MNGGSESASISRVVVALDASRHSLVVLEVAAGLAAVMSAELRGVFVEDVELLQLAGLPLAREVGEFSAIGRDLTGLVIERSLRATGAHARRSLTLAAERSQVSWAFHVTRGPVITELLEAARDADLVALGRTGRGLATYPPRLGSTARAFLTHGARSVLFSPRRDRVGPGGVVLFARTERVESVLTAAGTLARALARPLVILTAAADASAAHRVEAIVEERLPPQSRPPRYQHVHPLDIAAVQRIVTAERAAAFVLGSQPPGDEDRTFEQLIAALECAVLLVR